MYPIQDIIETDLYADDITLFLNNEDDMWYALNVIHKFSIFSGLEVNKTKSLWLGSNKNCTDTISGFNWKKKLKILGVHFCS